MTAYGLWLSERARVVSLQEAANGEIAEQAEEQRQEAAEEVGKGEARREESQEGREGFRRLS